MSICFLSVIFTVIHTDVYAQCAIPAEACPGTDLSNYGLQSNNDAATIEYDNFVSAFHSSVIRTSDGTFQLWGEGMSNNVTSANMGDIGEAAHLLSPHLLNSSNYPALTGTVLKASLGSNNLNNVQGVVLTTTGLFVWGVQGAVVSTTLTNATNTGLQPLTINGNGLPAGVTPGQVKMMFVTNQTIALTTCDGYVYVLSQRANMRQNIGSATQWVQVMTTAGTPLSGVVATRGSYGAFIALTSSGQLWTWGEATYLGNGTAAQARPTATQMTLPSIASGASIKMIGATSQVITPFPWVYIYYVSYYVLATDGNMYSLGFNSYRQLGDFTTTTRTSWVQPRYGSANGQVMNNITWMSPQEHDAGLSAVNVLTTDATLYAWGVSDRGMIGIGDGTANPGIPTSIPASDRILAVETGGHTTMIVKECEENFGYVGHRINGSMADGTAVDQDLSTYTFNTTYVQVCGAETAPVIPTQATSYCSVDTVMLVPDIPGGVFMLVSGNAILTTITDAEGIVTGATLTFNGAGAVELHYTIQSTCNNELTTIKVLTAENCPIDAVDDYYEAASGPQAVQTASVLLNDVWQGVTGLDAEDIALTSVTADAPLTLNVDGTVTVAPLTPPGIYTLQYQICDPRGHSCDVATATVFIAESSSLALIKTGALSADRNSIIYTFVIVNTGNVTIRDLQLADEKLSGLIVPSTTLAPGESITLTLSYAITEEDHAQGFVVNTATVSGTTPSGEEISDTSGTDVDGDDATVTFVGLLAVNDSGEVYSYIGGTAVANVLANDRYDGGEPGSATLENVTIDLVSSEHPGITLNGTSVVVAAGTEVGEYTLIYHIANRADASRRSTAVVTITVLPTVPVANDDTVETGYNTPVTIRILDNDEADVAPLDPGTVVITFWPTNGQLIVHADGTVTYTPNTGYTGSDSFGYTVRDAAGVVTNEATVAISVTGFFIPNVFTPNGDGVNDTFEIVGLAQFDRAELSVFNRWGGEVYNNRNYRNQWDGYNLNEGTYYYLLRLHRDGHVELYKGWVLIKRR